MDETNLAPGVAVTLWGGINGYLHLVDGTPEEVTDATEEAMRVLAPGGRFILAPADKPEARRRVEENTRAMIDACRRLR